MVRTIFAVMLMLAVVACPVDKPSTNSSGASGSLVDAGMGGVGGAAASSSPASNSSSGSSGGRGGEGGDLPPKPVDCATLNPGITCVEDDDCPPMTKPQLDACGPWKCIWLNPPDPDAGVQGKRGCVLSKP